MKPFEGLKIIDLSTVIAVSSAARILLIRVPMSSRWSP
jgi:hypothetical protein